MFKSFIKAGDDEEFFTDEHKNSTQDLEWKKRKGGKKTFLSSSVLKINRYSPRVWGSKWQYSGETMFSNMSNVGYIYIY